ncbi:DUF2807 domain-containing protein [Pontibacter sp. E15-1]|uniref:head GIN domain-containing protein n=1 Tax=Pontibacter sp. E15-1 TaxID=2919918 RepID=UPI001F4FB3BA|nr:head GIN domain-containing protein [Pontibacter sp. E15-1]MCJ8165922.1 DUF2807 domain-containing protein [Pontibacter sp. E15-1]
MRNYHNQKAGSTWLWVFLLLALPVLSACDDLRCIKGEGDVERRVLQLQPFSEVEANGDFRVYLTQGPTQQVEVMGEPNILDQLSTQVRNGKWKIEHEDCVRRSEDVAVYITIPEVKGVYLNGSGSIYGENKIVAADLPVEVNGSGRVMMEVEASKVILRMTGSGDAQLSGATDMQSINMSGSCTAAMFGLLAKDVGVRITGSGTAEVSASSTLTVNITGSGKVYYTGNPTVNASVSGSGKVVQK